VSRAASSVPDRLFPKADKLNAAKDRNLLILRSGLSAKGRQRLGSGGNLSRARPLLTSKTVYSLPASRSGAALPFDLSWSRPW
jgi:hypothetical protein